MDNPDYMLVAGRWEHTLRTIIQQGEEERNLGVVEIAKSLLLYGLKLLHDMLLSPLTAVDRMRFVMEMKRRTGLVMKRAIIDTKPETPTFPPAEWLNA
jgi:hypothetical protein